MQEPPGHHLPVDVTGRPVDQRQRHPGMVRGDQLADLRQPQRLGNADHLQRKFMLVDAAGNIDGEHELEIDRNPLCRRRLG